MDFQVVGENRKTRTYSADVWVQPCNTGIVLRSLEKLVHPGNSKRRKKVITLYRDKEEPILDSSVFDVTDTAKIESRFGKNLWKLRTRGYYILLNNIKNNRPGWTFAQVRKNASSTWRELSENKKARYMRCAALLLKAKEDAALSLKDKEDAANSLMH